MGGRTSRRGLLKGSAARKYPVECKFRRRYPTHAQFYLNKGELGAAAEGCAYPFDLCKTGKIIKYRLPVLLQFCAASPLTPIRILILLWCRMDGWTDGWIVGCLVVVVGGGVGLRSWVVDGWQMNRMCTSAFMRHLALIYCNQFSARKAHNANAKLLSCSPTRSLPPSGLCAHFHRVVVLAFVYCVERFKRFATCKRIHHQVEYFWNGTMYIRTRASMVRMLGSSVLVPYLRNSGHSRKRH